MDNWIANKEFNDLLNHIITDPNTEELILNMRQLNELFLPPFKKVKDCIIISNKDAEKMEMTFDKAIKMYKDKTGYEASNTETRLNCFFENDIPMVVGTQIALLVIDVWALKLKQMEPKSQFCLIMCCDEDHVEIRFHKIHDNEIMWLADDLESYSDGAVGYVIV